MAPRSDTTDRMWTVIQILIGLLTAINLSLTGWCLNTVISLQQDMASTKASRYTIENAKDDADRYSEQFLNVWREVADIQKTLETKSDRDKEQQLPTEAVRWLERHEAAIRRLEEKKSP